MTAPDYKSGPVRAADVNFDIYAVGLFLDIRNFRATRDWKRLRFDLRYPLRRIRACEWRHARNYFNGYLAEPIGYPEGLWQSAGTGWTRPAAVRNFWRRSKRLAASKTTTEGKQ